MEAQLIGFVRHSTAALISLLIWVCIDPVFRLEQSWVRLLGGVGKWHRETDLGLSFNTWTLLAFSLN